jgi:uncharacterized damage-inducible protein DinB
MTSLSDRYRRWFEYEKESHAKVLASLEAVPEPQRASEAFQKAAGLLAHVVLARWLWLARLGVVPRDRAPSRPEDFFPKDVSLSRLRSDIEEMERAWETYLSGMTDAELSRVFEYQALDGAPFRNTIEDILTQLFGHSWYHRGQISQLVRALGADPAVTDFVYWSREAL